MDIGIIAEIQYFLSWSGDEPKTPRTYIYIVFTIGRKIKYYISNFRTDLKKGELVLFALDICNDNKISECISFEQVVVYNDVESGNDYLCLYGPYMTQDWVEKISSHSYVLFAWSDDRNEIKDYVLYYKSLKPDGTIIEDTCHIGYVSSEAIYRYMLIKKLEKQNTQLNKNEAFEEDSCLSIISKKIAEITDYVNNIDLNSIVSDYHVYTKHSYIYRRSNGEEYDYVELKTNEDQRIDCYLKRLLPLYNEDLGDCWGNGHDCDDEARKREYMHKTVFFDKYDRSAHISTLLCDFLNSQYRMSYDPMVEKMKNEIEIERSKGWLYQYFCLEELPYTFFPCKNEDDVIKRVTEYNKK